MPPRRTGGRVRPPSHSVALVLLLLAACTFERRPDRIEDANDQDTIAVLPNGTALLEPQDSALAVAQLFGEALDLGDLSRALSYLHPGAALYNDAAAVLPAGTSAGEILLQELRLRQAGLRFEVYESEVTMLGDAALVLKRYNVVDPSATSLSTRQRTEGDALETIILVRSPVGWRIRHLHRSAVSPP